MEEIPLSKEIPDDPEVATLVNEFKQLVEAGEFQPKVTMDLYMMSQCPHSKPAMRTLFQVRRETDGALEPHIYYLVRQDKNGDFSAMYGEEEIQEDMRRICIEKVQPKKLVSYIVCRDNAVAGASWTDCASRIGIDLDALNRCLASDYPKKELTSMAMRSERLRVEASPTIYINNRKFGERLDETYLKRGLCRALGPLADRIEACSKLPKCLHDYDCPQKEGMISKCIKPGTPDAECVYEEAVKVPLTVLFDDHAIAANEARIVASTKMMMPGLIVEKVEASTPEGKALAENYGIDRLPGYIFGEEVTRARNFERLKSALERRKDRLVFRPDLSGAMIYSLRPRIAGKVDIFISATARAGLDGLSKIVKLRKEGHAKYDCDLHYMVYRDEKNQLVARGGLAELQEARRQVAMKILDGSKFDEYIVIRAGQPDNSYWEEPIEQAGLSPVEVKKLTSSEKVSSRLMQDAKLCKELRIGGGLVFLVDNREIIPIASNKMLEEILEKLSNRRTKGTDTQ